MAKIHLCCWRVQLFLLKLRRSIGYPSIGMIWYGSNEPICWRLKIKSGAMLMVIEESCTSRRVVGCSYNYSPIRWDPWPKNLMKSCKQRVGEVAYKIKLANNSKIHRGFIFPCWRELLAPISNHDLYPLHWQRIMASGVARSCSSLWKEWQWGIGDLTQVTTLASLC